MHTRVKRSRAGFTLTEILIAVGIMGVGLVLAIGIFPAAIMQQSNTVHDTVGMIACHNTLGMVKACLTYTNATAPGALTTVVLQNFNELGTPPGSLVLIPAKDLQYPLDTGGASGCFVLGRQLYSSVNDYQFVLISYAATMGGDPKPIHITADGGGALVEGDTKVNKPASPNKLVLGSPLIDAETGNYATIIKVNPDGTGVLDHPIMLMDQLNTTGFTAPDTAGPGANQLKAMFPVTMIPRSVVNFSFISRSLIGYKVRLLDGDDTHKGTISDNNHNLITFTSDPDPVWNGSNIVPDKTPFRIYRPVTKAYMVVEELAGGKIFYRSPAMNVLVANTALKP